jgi:hypothetical protein
MSLKGQKVVSVWVPKKPKPSVPFHVHLEVGYIFRISIQVSGSQFRSQDLNPGPNQLRDVPQGPKTFVLAIFWVVPSNLNLVYHFMFTWRWSFQDLNQGLRIPIEVSRFQFKSLSA